VKLNGFDRIAFVYDFLAKLIFGKSIKESQKHFLNKIEDVSKVLILGGGTGWLLTELLKAKPNCKVCYIDASEKMISLSKNKIKPKQLVHFIHGTEQDIPLSTKYDVVLTNFYLDLFTDQQLEGIMVKIRSSLETGANWIVTDFVNNGKWWQKTMLKIMYWFFRITCNIEPKKLPEWNRPIEKSGMKEIESKTFYHGFIETALYRF
jgi:tRNA (cmo5U34)-methyltransferase